MAYGNGFDYIVDILHEALRHEPGNSLVDAKSKQWEVEVGYSNTWRAFVDDLDRLYKTGGFRMRHKMSSKHAGDCEAV